MYNLSYLRRKKDRVVRPLAALAHEGLGITPNQASLLSFCLGTGAVVAIFGGQVGIALLFLAFTMLVDGLDGAIAREYNLISKNGRWFDMGLDAINEIMLFFALAFTGYVEMKFAFLASFAVILIRTIRDKSGFDPGVKRVALFLGYFTSFELALQIIFFANIAGFAIGTVITDYRYQKHIDNT